MKKVININFQGRVIPIEESAYDILKQYIETLRTFFANEEGCDEIINDIEGRIAELFDETIKKGSTCITDEDVNAVIASIGRPEDFDDDEAKVKSQFENQNSGQQSSQSFAQQPKKLFRDENSKIVAGVCAGIANYFGTDPLIIRILFVVFAGVTLLPYLILWVAVPSSSTKVIGSPKRRLLRDPDDKIIAGVCRGLSYYFGINVWIPRLLFLIPFVSFVFKWVHVGFFNFPFSITFSPGATLVYIILWLVLPEAKTTSEKLEMKGEKVDLNSIKNTVVSDIKDFKERVPQMAQNVSESIPKKAKEFSEYAQQKGRSGLGNVIALIIKIFVYFIVGSILFAVVCSLFTLGVLGSALLPLKHYILSDGWQTFFAWGVLILFIWIPVIGIIVWIIRRIAKIRSNSNAMRYGFLALWIVGLFCLVALIFSLRDDFKYHNYPQEQNVSIPNPAVNKLEVKGNSYLKYYGNDTWFHIEPFANIDEDTAYVRNVQIRIVKSDNDSFIITTLKTANGATRQEAEELVSKIDYNILQRDSLLFLDRGIAITSKEKFRNQKIYITIAVPVGKKIQVDDNAGGYGTEEHMGFGWDMNDWDWERDYNNNGDYDWSRGVEYIMTAKGLQRTDGKTENDNADENNDDNDDQNNADTSALYRYQKSREQLEKQRDEINKELEKTKDSATYHYQQPVQPAKPAPAAKEKDKSNVTEIDESSNRSINISSILMERFMM